MCAKRVTGRCNRVQQVQPKKGDNVQPIYNMGCTPQVFPPVTPLVADPQRSAIGRFCQQRKKNPAAIE
jgi:hypothetical protein